MKTEKIFENLNLDAVKKILTSDASFFLVKIKNKNFYSDEEIVFISFPVKIKTNRKPEKIKKSTIRTLLQTPVHNIFLFPQYVPFQFYYTIVGLADVVIIENKYAREFLKKALGLESNNWDDYVNLYELIKKENITEYLN